MNKQANKEKDTSQRLKEYAEEQRADAERDRPPVVCLGREGSQYVLYSTAYRRIERLTAEKLTLPNLRAIAPRARWEAWLFPERVAAGDEVKRGELVEAVQERILADCGAKMFDASRVRARGVWPDTTGGWVYNAGASCWFIPADGGKVEQIDHVRGDYVYSAGVALPSPADIPLSDEEGLSLVRLMRRAWVMPGADKIMAGWVVAGLLPRVLELSPHVWINAPADTGKTFFQSDLAALLGPFAKNQEGVPTDAGVRQDIDGDALPMMIDEVEPGDSEKGQKKINALLDLMRSASYGKNPIKKGSPDGTARAWYVKCSFALFSVANQIYRDSDSSRCLVLDLCVKDKKEREMIWAGQKAGRDLVQTPGFHGRLMARLLACLPVLQKNIAALRDYLGKADNVATRRIAIFSTLFSCYYALISRERVSQKAMQEAATLMLAYGEQEEKESDFTRCLAVLLGHVVRVRGQEMTVADACRVLFTGTDADTMSSCELSLGAAGLRWLDGQNAALQVDTLEDKMRRIYTGTQWSNGKIARVLAEGADRSKGKKGANSVGIYYRSEPKLGKRKCVVIPAALVIGEDE